MSHISPEVQSILTKFGLTVALKRVTTWAAGQHGHFAIYEITGKPKDLRAAAERVREKGFGTPSVRHSDIDGELYLEIQSVWHKADTPFQPIA